MNMKEFTLTLTPAEVNLIGSLLVKQPYEQVASLVDKINTQLTEQQPSEKPPEPAAAAGYDSAMTQETHP